MPVKLEQFQGSASVVDNAAIYRRVLAHCPLRRVALDIGAYQGEWSRLMGKDFQWVHAWEVRPENRLGMDLPENATLHYCGLSAGEGYDRFVLRKDYAQSEALGRAGKVEHHRVLPLDSYALKDIDLIKIDVDGGERNVIYGALETFEKNKPTLVIEVKFLNKFGRDDLMAELGYRLAEKVSPIDEVWVASRQS